jgi:hypothetical protein
VPLRNVNDVYLRCIVKILFGIYFSFSDLFLVLCFCGTGEPGASDQMHISRFGIFWGQTNCCLCHIQMPSSLEVIRS